MISTTSLPTIPMPMLQGCPSLLEESAMAAWGTAITMKKMLETQFPGIDVIIDNYPPPLPKRLFCKARVLLRFSAMVNRFSGEIELKDLVDKTLANSRVTDNLGVVWS
ncbi:hypothetical protein V6N13_126659 [Hibiscus sabdariffa]